MYLENPLILGAWLGAYLALCPQIEKSDAPK